MFPQEAISVQKLVSGHGMLTARQEYYYPGPKYALAMVPVLAVQPRHRVTTVSMTAWLDLMKSQSNKMRQTLISTRTFKTALGVLVPQV